MPSKSFHKSGITIWARMLTSDIWVNDIVIDLWWRKNGLWVYFFYLHFRIRIQCRAERKNFQYNGAAKAALVMLEIFSGSSVCWAARPTNARKRLAWFPHNALCGIRFIAQLGIGRCAAGAPPNVEVSCGPDEFRICTIFRISRDLHAVSSTGLLVFIQ